MQNKTSFLKKKGIEISVQRYFIDGMNDNLVGATIGVAVAYGLKAPPLVMFASADIIITPLTIILIGYAAAGAATVGCAAQMVGFAVASYRENGLDGILAQGLGTSMLQIGNIVKNPWILLPPTVAGAILGPFSTTIFKMTNLHLGAGMGTAGLVGQFTTITAMGLSTNVLLKILLLHFVAPGIIALAVATYMYKIGFIKDGDMKLDL